MYKEKYIKYKTKYLDLINQIYVGGQISQKDFEAQLIKYIKEEVEKFKLTNKFDFIEIKKDTINVDKKLWNWNYIKKNHLSQMKQFFDFRLHLVDTLIDKIFKYFNCGVKSSCKKIASGSVGSDANLLSDYDLTITEQNYNATKIISTFNSVIQLTFGSTPFEVFDTNLYGYSALIPKDDSKFDNLKTWELDLFGKHYFIPTSSPNKSQDKWAIIRLITFIENVHSLTKAEFPIIVNAPFYANWIKTPENNLSNVSKNPRKQNKLYIDKMNYFENLMNKYSDSKITNTMNITDIRDQMIESLSNMNFYGDETYFTMGSFMHVVGTMFYYRNEPDAKKIQFLTEGQLIHSMIENLAYFIHNFDHHKDIIIAVKYVERFMNAFKLLKEKQKSPLVGKEEIFTLMNEMKSKLRNSSNADLMTYFATKDMKVIEDKLKEKKDKFKSLILDITTKENLLTKTDFYLYLSILVKLLMSVITDKNSNIKITFEKDKFKFSL